MAAHAPNARKDHCRHIAQRRHDGRCADGGRLIAGRDAAHLDHHSMTFVRQWEAGPSWTRPAFRMEHLTAMMP